MLLLLALLGPAVQASSCCQPAGAATPGQLAADERLGLLMSGSAAAWMGGWSSDGDYVRAGDDQRWQARGALTIMARQGPAQLALGLPWVEQGARIGGVEEQGRGPGDLGLSLSLDGPRGGLSREELRPALRTGLSLPTGGQASETLSGVDLRGAGETVASAGLGWEGRHGAGPWSVGLDLQQPLHAGAAPRLQPGLMVGLSLNDGWDLLLGASPWWEGGSAAVQLSLMSPLRLDEHRRLLPRLSLSPPMAGWGHLSESWVELSVGLVQASAAGDLRAAKKTRPAQPAATADAQGEAGVN